MAERGIMIMKKNSNLQNHFADFYEILHINAH